MTELIIKGTDYSPEVVFSPKNNTYTIAGWSRPESPVKFFEPIFNWVDVEGRKHLEKATIHFNIDYFNTPSAKMIRHLLEMLDKLFKEGIQMNIIWQYDDEDSKEEFEYEFAHGLSLKIQFRKKDQ